MPLSEIKSDFIGRSDILNTDSWPKNAHADR